MYRHLMGSASVIVILASSCLFFFFIIIVAQKMGKRFFISLDLSSFTNAEDPIKYQVIHFIEHHLTLLLKNRS
jgi:hypothetical protein